MINGAPGTGKTTILKEMCASIFTARAMELAKLDESEITINGLLNPRLYGFDMTIFFIKQSSSRKCKRRAF